MKIVNTIIFIILLSSVSAYSQDEPLKDGIDNVLKQKLIDKLGLDNATADKFLQSYKENNMKIRSIMKEKKDLMETIELDPSSSDIDSKLNKMLDLESKIVDQKKDFFKNLQSFLTSQQIAKTIILRKNFDKELRKEINQKRKRNKLRDKEDKPGGDNR
jgi:hypothetical protein